MMRDGGIGKKKMYTFGKIKPQYASWNGGAPIRRTLYCTPSTAYPIHIVASAHSASATHTLTAYTDSPACELLRNGEWLPETGINACAPSPSSSAATPAWPMGPSGTHADNTPALPAGNPYNTSRHV